MEYGLGRLGTAKELKEALTCLNPCFNGIWSRTVLLQEKVLIAKS